MSDLELGGFEIPVLIVGITQVIKQLFPKLSDNGKLVVALVVGLVLFSLGQALPFVGEDIATIIVAVVRVLGYTMSVPGLFSVAKRELPVMLGR